MTKFLPALFLLTSTFTFSFCTNQSQTSGLPEHSHGKSAKPNYSIIFPSDKVNRIDIKIDKNNWNEMMVDLKSNIGSSGRMQQRPGNDELIKPGMSQQTDAEEPRQQRNHGGPPSGGLGMALGTENDDIPSQNREQRMGPRPAVVPVVQNTSQFGHHAISFLTTKTGAKSEFVLKETQV